MGGKVGSIGRRRSFFVCWLSQLLWLSMWYSAMSCDLSDSILAKVLYFLSLNFFLMTLRTS